MSNPLFVEWLQQIIDSVYFEGFHRILVKSGGENDLGQGNPLIEQFLDYTKSIEARHLYVKKDKIGAVFADKIDAFYAVFALGHNIYVANIFQKEGKFIAGKLFIVHNHGGQRHCISYG